MALKVLLLSILVSQVVSVPYSRCQAAPPGSGTYTVRLVTTSPPRIVVTADIPIQGQTLVMDETRPMGIPELDANGWPGIVANLVVTDETGQPLTTSSTGATGWQLAAPQTGRVTLQYNVGYTALDALGWTAPREAVFADANHISLIGRSLFITTPALERADVTFDLPKEWRALTPWESRSKSTFTVASSRDLVENLLVLSPLPAENVSSAGFRLQVVPMGHWRAARDEVRRVLGGVTRELVRLMDYDGRGSYLVVLLPVTERGGESFRNSFALTSEAPATSENSADWGNLLAHEIFHYWNGSRLAGADYATSQWFQEGFTEYAANLAMVKSGGFSPDVFMGKLATHVDNSRKLTTSLEGSGTRKGPPLYSAGALVAFCWDAQIRHETGGKRDLGDFFQALWKQTDGGTRPYAWSDIETALNQTAPWDWGAFHDAHIKGSEPLPLSDAFALVGLRFSEGRIDKDPAATSDAKKHWKQMTGGR